MKAKDMREKSLEDLRELEKGLAHDAFQAKFKNFTNRLDDSSQIQKLRRDLARVKTLLVEMQRPKASVNREASVPSNVAKAKAPGNASAKRAVTKSAKAAQSEATK
jgi:large subunit ribosomal protein L29